MKNHRPSSGENGQLVQSQGLVHSIPQTINLSNFSYPFDFCLQDQGISYKMHFLKSNPTPTQFLIIAKGQPQRGHSMFLGAWAQGQQPIIKLSVKSGKDGTGTPYLVTQGNRFQKTGIKKYIDLERGMKLRPCLHQCPGPI